MTNEKKVTGITGVEMLQLGAISFGTILLLAVTDQIVRHDRGFDVATDLTPPEIKLEKFIQHYFPDHNPYVARVDSTEKISPDGRRFIDPDHIIVFQANADIPSLLQELEACVANTESYNSISLLGINRTWAWNCQLEADEQAHAKIQHLSPAALRVGIWGRRKDDLLNNLFLVTVGDGYNLNILEFDKIAEPIPPDQLLTIYSNTQTIHFP